MHGGPVFGAYRGPNSKRGEFALDLCVYGRHGEPGPRCGARIERFVLGGRGTYLCPRYQK